MGLRQEPLEVPPTGNLQRSLWFHLTCFYCRVSVFRATLPVFMNPRMGLNPCWRNRQQVFAPLTKGPFVPPLNISPLHFHFFLNKLQNSTSVFCRSADPPRRCAAYMIMSGCLSSWRSPEHLARRLETPADSALKRLAFLGSVGDSSVLFSAGFILQPRA